MADIKISELTAVSSLNNGDLVEVSQVNELAPSGYTSLKATMTDIGDKVNTDIEYTTDLADFTDKTIVGAIKETAKGKNIADEYDDTQTYDKGDVVIYKNTLYICTTNNTTGTWDATKWTATTVQSLIGSLSTLTTTVKSSLVGAVNEVNVYKAGDTITASVSKYCAGRSTSDGSKVVFFYPLPKSVATNSSTLTITSNSNAWRHDGGPTSLTAGTYSGSVTDGGLYFIVDLASAITGNRSVNIELVNRTITFVNTP